MLAVRKPSAAVFVDRAGRQWVVRDPEGNYWSLPSSDNPWEQRQPFNAAEGAELEPVPGHYKDMLGLPF
jgi:hypothetical protein